MPVLLTSDSAQRWNPWSAMWAPLLGPNESEPTSAMLSADPGLALWVAGDSLVHALRFDTRNAYSTDTANQSALLTSDRSTDEFAPDRLGTDGDVSFGFAGLELRNGASAFLTDATFADVSVDFTGTGSGLQFVLRDNVTGAVFPILQGTCLPLLGEKPTAVQVVRQGGALSAGPIGGPLAQCNTAPPTASERLAIGFQGPGPGEGTATVSSVTVRRLGSAD
jgi:hypothetical protein